MRAPRLLGRPALVASASVGVCALALVAVLATRSTPPGETVTSGLGGRSAPAIAGPDLLSGRHVSLASFRGRVVVVTFFASWCPPCKAEAAALESFEFEHQRSGDAVVLGVDIADTATNGRAFLSEIGATWPAVEDPGTNSFSVAWGVSNPPESFVVAPDGRVAGYVVGQVTRASLDALVTRAKALR